MNNALLFAKFTTNISKSLESYLAIWYDTAHVQRKHQDTVKYNIHRNLLPAVVLVNKIM